mmetsp:Transcript_40065/g.96728  ORF Transcript_40065/g.96728 Transcript_40065/m.96728 type:complete len:214 (-) Transcript_40065:297-938(-)
MHVSCRESENGRAGQQAEALVFLATKFSIVSPTFDIPSCLVCQSAYILSSGNNNTLQVSLFPLLLNLLNLSADPTILSALSRLAGGSSNAHTSKSQGDSSKRSQDDAPHNKAGCTSSNHAATTTNAAAVLLVHGVFQGGSWEETCSIVVGGVGVIIVVITIVAIFVRRSIARRWWAVDKGWFSILFLGLSGNCLLLAPRIQGSCSRMCFSCMN